MFLISKFSLKRRVLVAIPPRYWYYVHLHFNLSTPFYLITSIDLTGYSNFFKKLNQNQLFVSIISILRVHLNLAEFILLTLILKNDDKQSLNSITNLFSSLNWAEREAGEMLGFSFFGHPDSRNLLLQFSDKTAPIQKLFPVFGLGEVFYDLVNDELLNQPVMIQF